jgi:hypothetical protein
MLLLMVNGTVYSGNFYDFSEENVASMCRIKPYRSRHYVLAEKLFAPRLLVGVYQRFGKDILPQSSGWKKL